MCFFGGVGDGNVGEMEDVGIEEFGATFEFSYFPWSEFFGEGDERFGESEEDEGTGEIKDGVGVGDLTAEVGRGEGGELGEGGEKGEDDNNTQDVDESLGNGNAFGG